MQLRDTKMLNLDERERPSGGARPPPASTSDDGGEHLLVVRDDLRLEELRELADADARRLAHHDALVLAAGVEQRKQLVEPGDEGLAAALRHHREHDEDGAAAVGVVAAVVQPDLLEHGACKGCGEGVQ